MPKKVLAAQEQMEIVRLLAHFWKPTEISKYLKEKFGRTIAYQTVSQYLESKKWQPFLQKFREDYQRTMHEVPLFHKRKRLDELQKHYDHHMAHSQWKAAREVLKDVKNELENKSSDISFNFTQINHTEYHEMTDEEIAQEKSKILEQLDRAQKMKRLLENKGEERAS